MHQCRPESDISASSHVSALMPAHVGSACSTSSFKHACTVYRQQRSDKYYILSIGVEFLNVNVQLSYNACLILFHALYTSPPGRYIHYKTNTPYLGSTQPRCKTATNTQNHTTVCNRDIYIVKQPLKLSTLTASKFSATTSNNFFTPSLPTPPSPSPHPHPHSSHT